MGKVFESGKCRMYKVGGFWEVMGSEQGGATREDRSDVRKQVTAALEAISPEALDLARAYHAILSARTADEISARQLAAAGPIGDDE